MRRLVVVVGLVLLAVACVIVGLLERGDLAVQSRLQTQGSSFTVATKTGVSWLVAGAAFACAAVVGEIRRRRGGERDR